MADASPGPSVGGITFKISVDLSAVDMKGLLDLNLRFNALEKAFEKLARNAQIVSYAFTELALINKTMRETIGKLTGAKNDLEKAQKKLIAASKTYQAALKQTAEQTKDAEAKTVSLTDKVSGLASAAATVASAFASLRLGEFIKEATLYAGRVENLGTILEQVGINAGYTSGELGNFEESVKSLGITTEAARYSMTLMARNHLDLAKAAELARLAQDSAVIAGLNSSDSFEKIAISVQRLDTRMLRNQGILINLRNEYQRFALAAGRTETSLTAAERQQILLNAVLRAGVNVAGTYEAAMEDTYKQWTSIVRFTREALREFGEEFQGIFRIAVSSMTELLKLFIAAPSGIKSFTAAMASFVVVAGAAATAIAGLTLAVRALSLAAASHPALLALSLAIGAIGSAITFISAQAEDVKRETDAINSLAAAESARLVGLSNIVKELKVLHATQSSSQSAQNDYLILLDRAIRMTGEYELEIRKLSNAESQYQKLLQITPTSAEDLREKQLAKLREMEQQLKKVEAFPSYGYMSTIAVYAGPGTRELEDRIQQERAITEKMVAEWKNVINAQMVREFEKAIEAQDNVFQQSLRLQDNLQRARVKSAKSANVEIASSYTGLRSAIEGTIVSEEDLRKHAELRREAEKKRITESYESEMKGLSGDALLQKRAEMNITLLKSEEAIQEQLEVHLATRRKLIEISDEMFKISMLQLEQEKLSTILLEKRMDAMDNNVPKELIDIEEQNLKLVEQNKIALEELYAERKRLSELEIKSGEDEKKRRQDLAVNEKAIRNEIRKTTAELEDNLRKRRDYWRDAMKDRLEQMETLNEELAELEGKQTEMTVKEIQKRRDERKKDMEDTAKFIRDQKIEIMEKEQPGREGITSEFDRYKEAVSKAQTPQQLAELRKLFPKKLAGAYDERAEKLKELEEKLADKQRKVQGELMERQSRIFSAENPMRRMQLINEYQQYVMEKQKELQGDYAERNKLRGQLADRGRFIGVARNDLEGAIRKREQELRDQQNMQREEDRIMKEKIASKKAELFEAQAQLKVEQEKTREYEKQLAIAKMIRGERNLATAKTPEERQAAIETITSGQRALWDIKNRPLPKTAEDAERMYAPRATSASWWEGRRRGVGPPLPPPVAPRPLPAYDTSDMSGNVSIAGVDAAKGIGRMGAASAKGFNTAAKVIKNVNDTANTAADEIEEVVVELRDMDEETRQLRRKYTVRGGI